LRTSESGLREALGYPHEALAIASTSGRTNWSLRLKTRAVLARIGLRASDGPYVARGDLDKTYSERSLMLRDLKRPR
jgi:hypothetical protein